MNYFLSLCIILTAPLAQAEAPLWYRFASNACSESQNSFEPSQYNPDFSKTRLAISKDLLTAVQESRLEDGTVRTVGLKLNKIGKNTYMVTPQMAEGTFVHFTVVLSEDQETLQTNFADMMQSSCGGGLVVSTYIKDASVSL